MEYTYLLKLSLMVGFELLLVLKYCDFSFALDATKKFVLFSEGILDLLVDLLLLSE